MFPCERIPKTCLSVHTSKKKNHHTGFVNISPTLVIDTSMERSSRVLQHGNPKFWFFFSKVRNWILSVSREKKSPWLRQYQSYISYRDINGKVFTSTTAWKLKNEFFFSKKFENEFWQKLNFYLIKIQVGLYMHLYDYIGDASLSFRGSTYSIIMKWIKSSTWAVLFSNS